VTTAEPVLVIEQVEIRRAGPPADFAVRVPRLVLRRGERIAVTGPSGSGKSTLLDALALSRRPEAARRFRLASEDAACLWQQRDHRRLARLRARALGYVLQTGGLVPFLSVAGNAALVQDLAGGRDWRRIHHLADRLRIARLLDRMPESLSRGERQRAAILRGLAHRPALLIADEPTANVERELAEEILGLLVECAAAEGAALLLATHDIPAAQASGFVEVPLRRGDRQPSAELALHDAADMGP
jgi:putative ABC transport system ATP-binding protein